MHKQISSNLLFLELARLRKGVKVSEKYCEKKLCYNVNFNVNL